MKALLIALSLLFVAMPFVVMLVILANMAIAEYRERKRHGWEMEPIDRAFLELCKVTLMIAVALGGW